MRFAGAAVRGAYLLKGCATRDAENLVGVTHEGLPRSL
jgi:hypothetical protein